MHPEDDAISEDDLEVITLENVLTNDMYNDLGFLVRDKLIVLVEAQTTWSRNIIMRMFLYLARTYQDLIYNNSNLRVSLYSSKKMELPKPELYVIYTGSKGDKSETLSLKDDVFPDSDDIDLKAKVIFADKTKRDIINQYIAFCGILKEQMNKIMVISRRRFMQLFESALRQIISASIWRIIRRRSRTICFLC